MKNLNKILYIICILIIIAGAIVLKFLGTNYSIENTKGKSVEIYFDYSTNKNDITAIAKETFGENIKVSEIERFNDAFAIFVKDDITDEQKNNFISKINEKYSLEKKVDDLTITDIPKMQGKDLVKSYITPSLIAMVIIFIYLCIRYFKIGNVKVAVEVILKVFLITGAYFGIVVITRLPIVNMYTVPVGILIAIITLITLCYKNEIKLKEFNKEKKK